MNTEGVSAQRLALSATLQPLNTAAVMFLHVLIYYCMSPPMYTCLLPAVPSMMEAYASPCLARQTSLHPGHWVLPMPLYLLLIVNSMKTSTPSQMIKTAETIFSLLGVCQCTLPALVLLGAAPTLKLTWGVLLPVLACATVRIPATSMGLTSYLSLITLFHSTTKGAPPLELLVAITPCARMWLLVRHVLMHTFNCK